MIEVDNRLKSLAEQVFLGEIVHQVKIANRAAERLINTDALEVWCSIQSILVSAGIVSMILWPSPKSRYVARGEMLRKLLNIDDNNLLSNRDFRNHFEHYDERIEESFQKNPSAVYTDLSIDSFKSIWGRNPVNLYRGYNTLTHTLTFRGESLDIVGAIKALEEIRQKCQPFTLDRRVT